MPSVCISTPSSYQQFQPTNGNIMLPQSGMAQHHLHQQLHQQHQQQQQQHHFLHQKQQFQQHIAPKAPLGNSQLLNMQTVCGSNSSSSLGTVLLNKKKSSYTSMPPFGEQMPSVARRNARERNRVKQVNNGFVNLRQHIPTSIINALSHGGRGASKKLSKVDTLRIAVEYIRGLKDLLEDAQPGFTHFRQHNSQQKLFHSDDSSNDDSYTAHSSSMGSPSPNSSTLFSFDQQKQRQQQQELQYQLHSYHSECSNSPPPSFMGESNINYMQHIKLEVPEQQQPQHKHSYPQKERQHQIKFEAFDSFSDERADDDDEELLDYISSWQEE